MSLFGALHLGGASLAAQQTALEVTGNNIANTGTAGYTREVADLTPTGNVQTSTGVYVGSGVSVASVQRQVSESLNETLRGATSDQNAANTLNTQLTQLQATFGALNDNDLASQLTSFFNGFSTLANDPTDAGQRSIVIQSGQSLAESLTTLRQQVSALGDNVNAQVATTATQVNSLAQQVASLNGQIAALGGQPSAANTLLDQRDQALTQLSTLVDTRTTLQANGTVNVLVGSIPLVSGTTTRGVSTTQTPSADGTTYNTQVVFADNNDPMTISGGQLGGLINARDNYITPAIGTIDTVAAGLISTVNSISSQGQGLSGFSNVTGTTSVLDPTAALNASTASTGIAFPPTNGSFNLYMTDATTGQVTTQQINVNLSGQGTQTTLNSLAASISAAGGGNVTASVNTNGNLVINSSNSNVTFGFGEDTSGTLAALGVNTFFTGSSAADIGVNQALQNDPDLLATGRGNVAGSNQNAQALALAGAAASSQLGGKGLNDYYTGYIGDLATQTQTATNNATAQGTIYNTLYSQQQAVSGVSMDEETINLTQFQRAFEGSAKYISTINQMMQTVIALVQ